MHTEIDNLSLAVNVPVQQVGMEEWKLGRRECSYCREKGIEIEIEIETDNNITMIKIIKR